MSALGNWSFTPLVPAFPTAVLPNIALWDVTNAVDNRTYQIQVSWPFEWESREVVNKTALTMYVIDGNALGMTAAEGFKRRKPVEPTQPDSVVVSIGYPLTDSVYDFTRRFTDFRPPLPQGPPPGEVDPTGADPFIEFIDGALRPWVRNTVFPSVEFTRDALYGHSFGGLFVIYALTKNQSLFDTFLSASPAIDWNNGSILDTVSQTLGKRCWNTTTIKCPPKSEGPAFMISYGELEQFPVKRRTETQEQYEERRAFLSSLRMTDNSRELYRRVRYSDKLRDVVLKEYKGSDHSTVGASAVNDGIDYFVDW